MRLDTGSGAGAEAELAVLSLAAVAELRDAVRIGRRGQIDATPEPEATTPDVLVALDPRELLLHGLLTASGWVVICRRNGRLVAGRSRRLGAAPLPAVHRRPVGGLGHATPAVALESAC